MAICESCLHKKRCPFSECDMRKCIDYLQNTEENYLRSCTTEQLAEVLFSWYKLGRLDVINKHTEVKKDWLIEHLEQPHRGE